MKPDDAVRALAEASGGVLTWMSAGGATIAVGHLENRHVITIVGGPDWITITIARYDDAINRHELGQVTVSLGTPGVIS